MNNYFARTRNDILDFIPENFTTILEIGCGEGETLKSSLKRTYIKPWVGGVEIMPLAAEKARPICDKLWVGNIENIAIEEEIKPNSIDAILCLDVLEHLVDPWKMIKRLTPLLSDHGRLIISLPDIRNWKFIFKLLFRGDFDYKDAGLLDRTHLRFFVRRTGIDLAMCAGLNCIYAESANRWKLPDVRAILSLLTGGAIDEILAKQWVIVCERKR